MTPDTCIPCTALDDGNPARISRAGGASIIGGGVPVFNGEDGAIGSHPSKANFLSQLQRSLEDAGASPAGLYGYARGEIPEWYRPELLPTVEAPEGFPTARADAWDDYLDGVNMGTFRGGMLGLLLGAGGMLAALYFGGAMVSSPKPSASKALSPKPATASSQHRHTRKARSRKGR